MNALQRHFLDQPVSQFTGEKLLPFIERGRPTLKTYNNRRSLVSNFFRYAVQHGWAAENPVEKTPYYRVAHLRGSAKTISAERAAALMDYLETYMGGTLVPYFSLCLFAGVRPCFKTGEISKLQPESVMLDTRAIHIEPSVSKVRMKRVVTIQPNLAAWLSAYLQLAGLACIVLETIRETERQLVDYLECLPPSLFLKHFALVGPIPHLR